MLNDNDERGGMLYLNIVPVFRQADFGLYEAPKHITIKDSALKVVMSYWTDQFLFSQRLPEGKYVISVDITSYEIEPQVVTITNGGSTEINFVTGYPNRFFRPNMRLSKFPEPGVDYNYGMPFPPISYSKTKVLASARYIIWAESFNRNKNRRLQIEKELDYWDFPYTILHESATRKYLQIIPYEFPAQIICLPVDQDVRIFVQHSGGPEGIVSPFQVDIVSDRQNVNTLLDLLLKGAFRDAKALFHSGLAEDLLYNKRTDASGAAVGAYFLLRTNELNRLHDWTTNLDNWFPWLPDGSVIHAWHLIYRGSGYDLFLASKIKERFVEAVDRGVPVYTEGLRLLYEGLLKLSYTMREDKDVLNAFQIVQKQIANADMSKQYTIFKGNRPDNPGVFIS